MKIAIYHNLPSGGAKRTLYETVKRLFPKHTLDVYRLSTADEEFYNLSEFLNTEYVFQFSPAKLFGSPFGRLNQLQRFLDLLRLDRLARRIARQIDEGEYDVVFAQPCMWTQAPFFLRYLETPSIYYCHELPRNLYEPLFGQTGKKSNYQRTLDLIDPFIRLYHHAGRRFDYQATRSANKVLVNSAFVYEQVRVTYKIDPLLSYLGVDTDIFRPSSKIGDSHNYILSVGALQPHKGYRFLIESIGHVDDKVRPALHLIGNVENNGEREILQSLAMEKGVDLYIEVGVGQKELVQKYNNASLVAYTPYKEPFGLVPLEAMACGIPVVGVREGGVLETVLHERTGLLTDRNAEHFGAAVQNLLMNPKLIKTYGRNGRKHVLDNWSWDKAILTLTNYLENCRS
jgi:glycosyltransferase involved in cell wall biosynthesis